MQDYKCLSVVVMICDTLVNTQTHRQDSFWPVILLAHPAELKNPPGVQQTINILHTAHTCGQISITREMPASSLLP